MKKTLLFLMIFASVITYQAMGQCGKISLIGEFNGWAGDHWMDRNPENPALFTTILSLDSSDNDYGLKNIVEMKFRQNADWTVNWGAETFPTGTGTQGGPNIPVVLDDTLSTKTTDYYVTFNCETGEYSFTNVCGSISIIGELNDWASDVWMTRDMMNLNMWSAIISLDTSSNQYGALDTIEMKFRESANWTVNWGGSTFPSGTGTQDGPNIKVPIDTSNAGGLTTDYLVTFNCSTGEYNFQPTNGPISLIGEFNGWAGDLFMTRMASNPNMWTAVLPLDTSSDGYGNVDIIEVKFL